MKKNKNGFGNGLKKYGTLIKTYKRPQPKYQICAWVLFRKNSFYYISSLNRKLKNLWEWLEKYYILKNFVLKWNMFGKLYTIQYSKYRNFIDYISQIEDV